MPLARKPEAFLDTTGERYEMIRVAICDDEKITGEAIYKKVESFFAENRILFQAVLFDNSKSFGYEIDEDIFFDMILLDIEMPELSGMELAKRIRKKLPDVIIIFVTSYEKYVYDVFSLEAFRFIPKDQIEQRLSGALLDAVNKWKHEEGKFYLIENGRGIEKIPLKHIVRIWREGKYAVISKENGESTKVRKTLMQVYDELPKEDFEWIDRGCICNLSQIRRIDGENIVLRDGNTLPMVRGRILEIKARIRNYWMEREGL